MSSIPWSDQIVMRASAHGAVSPIDGKSRRNIVYYLTNNGSVVLNCMIILPGECAYLANCEEVFKLDPYNMIQEFERMALKAGFIPEPVYMK